MPNVRCPSKFCQEFVGLGLKFETPMSKPAKTKSIERIRCAWAKTEPNLTYHDKEWGIPVHDDRLLFEFLILEGAQAGLSWITVLRKREHYREAFDNFEAALVA